MNTAAAALVAAPRAQVAFAPRGAVVAALVLARAAGDAGAVERLEGDLARRRAHLARRRRA